MYVHSSQIRIGCRIYKEATRLRDSLRSFEEEAWVSGPYKVFDELPLQVFLYNQISTSLDLYSS
jgi:hypothetical protein